MQDAGSSSEQQASIYWEGFSAANDLVAVLVVLASGPAIWWNTRHVRRHEHALIALWAAWHIDNGSRFVALWTRDLEALRD